MNKKMGTGLVQPLERTLQPPLTIFSMNPATTGEKIKTCWRCFTLFSTPRRFRPNYIGDPVVVYVNLEIKWVQ